MARNHNRSFELLNNFSGYAPGWGGMFMMLLMLLLGTLLGSVLQFALILSLGNEFMMSYGMVVTYPVMFLPPMFYAIIKSHNATMWDAPEIPLDQYAVNKGNKLPAWLLALMCFIATICAAFVVEPLLTLIPTDGPVMGKFYETMKEAMEQLLQGPLWVSILCTTIFAPFFEEWLCRGMILRGLLQKTSPAVAIAVSALFFALIHANPWQAVPAFALGCLFGLVYYKTGSLKLTMLMHFANNSFSVLISRIPAFEGKDYFFEVITDKLQYGLIFLLCLSLLVLFVCRIYKLERA